MSSLVAAAGKVIASTPSACTRARPGARPSGVGVDDDLGAAGQRVVADRVHVADDHVGLVAGLDERVGAAVDADEHRPVVADVGAEGLQVLLVVVAADDDQHVPALDLGRDVGHADAVEQERALPLHVLHRVGRERLELRGQPRLRLGHRRGDRLARRARCPRRATVPSSVEQLVALEADLGALLERGRRPPCRRRRAAGCRR